MSEHWAPHDLDFSSFILSWNILTQVVSFWTGLSGRGIPVSSSLKYQKMGSLILLLARGLRFCRETAQLHVNRQRWSTDLVRCNTLDAYKDGDVYERTSNRKPLATGCDSVLSTNSGKKLAFFENKYYHSYAIGCVKLFLGPTITGKNNGFPFLDI